MNYLSVCELCWYILWHIIRESLDPEKFASNTTVSYGTVSLQYRTGIDWNDALARGIPHLPTITVDLNLRRPP